MYTCACTYYGSPTDQKEQQEKAQYLKNMSSSGSEREEPKQLNEDDFQLIKFIINGAYTSVWGEGMWVCMYMQCIW